MPEVRLSLSEQLYKALAERASKEGFKSVEEYVVHILNIFQAREHDLQKIVEEQVSRHVARTERRLSDTINAYTSKIEELGSKIASIVEELEEIKSRIDEVEARIQGPAASPAQRLQAQARPGQPRRATAMDILKQQKVFYESSVVGKIKDRDRFFARLEREGAVIIAVGGERVAVDPEFWEEFMEKLSRITSDSESAARAVLADRKEIELFEKLKQASLLVFDATEKRWTFIK